MNNLWWKNAIIYQIYPRSFADSNNDGIGDIKGIISKLPYLENLGITHIWLSPIYESPMDDNGYDVADYYKISSDYGSLDDLKELIFEAKKHNIGILLDLVFNHTSTSHEWFLEAIRDKNSKYHDYYLFRKECDDTISTFGGSAWEYVEALDEYYFHYFAVTQADLNWKNPEVRQEMVKIMEFYMDLGVEGFRLDAIELIGKELEQKIYASGPKIHDYLHEVISKVKSKYPYMMTVGEGWPDIPLAKLYTDPKRQELDMIFQFESPTLTWDKGPIGKFLQKPFKLNDLKNILQNWQLGLNDFSHNALFWENHDLNRSINRLGSVKYQMESAKALAAILFLMRGTPFVYQGEELGLADTNFTLEEIRDIEALNLYQEYVIKNKEYTGSEFLKMLNVGLRDQSRLTMPWSGEVNGGFNDGHTSWIKTCDYTKINAAQEVSNPHSVYNFYKKIFELRKTSLKELLGNGKFKLLPEENLFAYSLSNLNSVLEVYVNLSENIYQLDGKDVVDRIIIEENIVKGDKTITFKPYGLCICLVNKNEN